MSNEIYPASAATSAIRGLGFTVVKRPAFNTIVQVAPNRYETRISQTQNPVWRWTLTYDVLFDHANLARTGLAYTELRSLVGFFLARLGQYDSFLFSDPDDNYVGPGVSTAGWAASTYYPVNSSLLVASHWQKATVAGISGASAPAFSTSGGYVSEGPSSPQLRWDDQGTTYTAVPNLFASLPLVENGAGAWFSPLQRNLGGFYEDVTDLNGTAKIYANGVLQTITTNYTIAGPGLALPAASYMGLYAAWVGTPTGPITAEFNFYFRVRFETDEVDFEKFVNELWTVGGPEAKGGSGAISLVSSRPPL